MQNWENKRALQHRLDATKNYSKEKELGQCTAARLMKLLVENENCKLCLESRPKNIKNLKIKRRGEQFSSWEFILWPRGREEICSMS